MTLNAHRLVSKAYEIAGSAVQSALITLIFRAYCEDDLDVNDHEVLADAAEQSGAMSKLEVSMSLLYWLVAASARNPPFHLLRGGAHCISIRFGMNRTSLRLTSLARH